MSRVIPSRAPSSPASSRRGAIFQTTRTDSNGRAWGVFRVLSEGSVTITATAVAGTRDPASDSLEVETGQTASTVLSEPGRVWVVAPLEQRRTSGRFTVQALVTDANGGAMPDGTPVAWRAIGFSGAAELEAELWRASAADQTTTGGVAEATFARVPTQASNNKVLVIASAGDASASVYFETDQAVPTGEGATVGLQLERATGQERWQLLDPGRRSGRRAQHRSDRLADRRRGRSGAGWPVRVLGRRRRSGDGRPDGALEEG